MAGNDSIKTPCRRCGDEKAYRRHVPIRIAGFVRYQILCHKCIKLQLAGDQYAPGGTEQ